jgi:nitroreductase
MELEAASRSRHMTRSFSGAPLDPGLLDKLLDMAARAPSAGNTDGRRFVVLVGKAETDLYWHATTTPAWRGRSRRWPGMSKAPVVVVVFVSPSNYMDRYDEPDKRGSNLGHEDGESAWPVPYWYFDAGASVMAMLLGAASTGTGACFLGAFRGERELLEVLAVEGPWRLAGAVLLGEPGGEDPPSASLDRARAARGPIVHYGKYKRDL